MIADPNRPRLMRLAEPGEADIDLSIVVPCYNEEEVLSELHRRLAKVCDGLAGTCEIVLVNDGSRDGTRDVMRRLVEQDPRVTIVDLSRNYGHQPALAAGLESASGRRIAMIDADLQDPPELLPEMLRLMDEGADVVYAQRSSRRGDSVPKRIAAFLFYRILRTLAETEVPVDSGDFRVITRRVLDELKRMPERDRFIRGMIAWTGFRQVPCPYDRDKRFAGESKYPLGRLIKLAVDGLVSSSLKPLRWMAMGGAAVSLLGALVAAYSAIAWLAGGASTGTTLLGAAITFWSGVQLVGMGVLGEYVGRIYQETRARPLFIIDEVVRGRDRVVEHDRQAMSA